jgi:hypothetical protein
MHTKKLILAAIAALCVSSAAREAECFACKRVECTQDIQCGARCSCVKLNDRIKGSCVQAW